MSFILALTAPLTAFAQDDWIQFKSAFIKNGRVIDKGQNGISHTEGQGMALLLAVQNNDPETFSQVWNWTKSKLQVRDDKLFAWSWSPQTGVNDSNNASDGDLFIAWALSRAYTRWNEPSYLFAGIQVSQSIRAKLLRKTTKGTVLLPGANGFEKPEFLKLNLSYWIFPAINELSILDPAPEWEELRVSGLRLIEEARFGKWQLPSDWITLEGEKVTPVDGDQFGYDAVRIPLYLIWGQQATPSSIKPFQNFWGSYAGKSPPAWVNVSNGETATYNASEGFQSIAAMALAYPALDSTLLPSFNPSQGYYSSMLSLFTQMALEDLKK
ncbi:glycosyl hydrolase family 8 [Polynucleobacter ibericus]|uniref:glycosyl hydrolase family 8 n=1 Tax=Polynucleobacter ibericus TaxID=1819725 RepID=UPI001BFDBF8D|nr:glycosyl hydrolase family 8 [Polynucleobacter ibericus]QWE07952.1 glycosyl hydrolase family 5 [Polynucleobacter ibericus]